MTVREIYERGVKSLPAIDQLRLASLILSQLTQSEADDLAEQIRKATPSNEHLLELARTHVPPQSWWDEEVNDAAAPSSGQ
jgi:hypothetical protein